MKIKLLVGTIGCVLIYLFMSSPDDIAINKNGNVKGIFNHVRAGLQGERFWKNQVDMISADLQWELTQPKRLAAINSELNKTLRDIDRSMEDMYREYPEMRPSAAERRADALRVEAERIEDVEMNRFLEKARLEKITELQTILPIAKARVR